MRLRRPHCSAESDRGIATAQAIFPAPAVAAPEPGSLLLTATALAGLTPVLFRRRRRAA